MFLKNKNIIFKIKRSKVTDYAALKAMIHINSKNPLIQKLLEKCHELSANKEIVLSWIPSHICIQGYEMVDHQATTLFLGFHFLILNISHCIFKPSSKIFY